MAARTDGENVPVFGHFHQTCGVKVALSEGRRVASGRTYFAFDPFPPPPIAFSNDPIPKGAQFSVKVLHQESKDYVSPLIHTPCSLQCTPCLDSAHTRAVDQLAPRLVSFGVGS